MTIKYVTFAEYQRHRQRKINEHGLFMMILDTADTKIYLARVLLTKIWHKQWTKNLHIVQELV